MEEKKSILHELYVFSEWKPEPEYIQKSDNILPENISALWRWLKYFGPKKSLIDSVTLYRDKLQKWLIALGDEGKVIAVLADNILEIRTKRSEYATIAARTTVNRDSYPAWRQLVWSPDCSFVAVAYGNGVVSFFDLTASNLFNIPIECSRRGAGGGLECADNTHAVAQIIFMPLRVKDNKWNWEVLVIEYLGSARLFLVSATEGYSLLHRFQFPGGVGSALYCANVDTLYVAGPALSAFPADAPRSAEGAAGGVEAGAAGVTAWRRLSDEPYYALSAVSDALATQISASRHRYRPHSAFRLYLPFFNNNYMALVVKMVVSEDGRRLVCAHCNGDVSVWTLPLLRLQFWHPLAAQPEVAPIAATRVADLNWWSNEEIIVSRFSGAVTICNVEDMRNILGDKPEYLQGSPQVSAAHMGACVALECETSVVAAASAAAVTSAPASGDTTMDLVKVGSEGGGEGEESLVEAGKELVKKVLYAITDMETFQPRPRRITVVSRVYRLLGIKSTTPQELFARKIESGAYGEALSLAHAYALDSDLVYQQQWRKNPVSTDAIHNYLSKVCKKIWAVYQCVDRLPETLPAAKELLHFGLQLTNEEILKEINKARSERGEEHARSGEQVLASELNAYSSELLRCRHVMLFYKERLALYESMLKCEKSCYSKNEYDRLRSNSIVFSATEIAKEGRIEALTCLWPHMKSLSMQLAVLDHIPETLNPIDYKQLLPSNQSSKWCEKSPHKSEIQHEHDWCRKEIFRSIWSSNWSEDASPDTDVSVNHSDISKWYDKRAREIEERSGLVSHALTLVTLASQVCGVTGLDHIIFHLVNLDVLLYDVNVSDVTLNQLEKMSTLDTCAMLMSMSTGDTFVSDVKQHVIPYLKRLETVSRHQETCVAGLADYLESISVHDLSNILLVLQSPTSFELDVRTHLELAERCLYAYTDTEHLDKACDLLDTILNESDGSISPSELVRRVHELERVVSACACAADRGVHVTPQALRDMRAATDMHAPTAHTSAPARTLLTKIARSLPARNEKPTQQDWEKLLKDILELQASLFSHVTKEQCYEIYASSLLTSGDAASIKLAAEVLTCEQEPHLQRHSRSHLVTYSRSVELVSDAAKEYFNSASSLTDSALELARCCLILIKDSNAEIEKELDLISALSILSCFDLEILPIQVRLCEDKMTLIEACLKSDTNAYLAGHKLLKLAKLLRISPHDEQTREGRVLQLVGEHAVSAGGAGGAAAALSAATRLAALRYSDGGPGSAALLARAAAAPHADTHARRHLYAAAAAYCAPEHIEHMLTHRLRLELEELQQAHPATTSNPPAPPRCPSTDDEFSDAITTPVVEKKDLVSVAARTRSDNKTPLFDYLLASIHNKFAPSGNKSVPEESAERRVGGSVHCQEFYRSLYPEHQVSEMGTQNHYSGFSIPDPMSGACTLLHWYYTQNCLENGLTSHLEPELVNKCVEEIVEVDTALSVACRLRAVSVSAAHSTAAVTAAAVTCLLYATLLKCNAPELRDNVYLTPPAQMAIRTLKKKNTSEEQMQIMRECMERLAGAGEVREVRRLLGSGVSSGLFRVDPDYRRELIHRLARSWSVGEGVADARLERAYSLARKYGEDVLEVWLQHAADAATAGALPRVTPPPTAVVAAAGSDVHTRIHDALWHVIPGTAHDALMAYFSLQSAVAHALHAHSPHAHAPAHAMHGLTAAEHIKLLKKAKAASSELDYKLLVEHTAGAEQAVAHLVSVMKPETVGLVCKWVRALPPALALRPPLTLGALYARWLTTYMFTMGSNTVGGTSNSSGKWMQHYRQCASYFNKLGPRDLRTFIQQCCFGEEAILRIPATTRALMLLQAADYCHQEHDNYVQMNVGVQVQAQEEWGEVGAEMSRWARFIDNYHSTTVQNIVVGTTPRAPRTPRASEDVATIWTEIEKSHGETETVAKCLVQLLLETEMSVGSGGVQTLVQCLHVDVSVHEVLERFIDAADSVLAIERGLSLVAQYEAVCGERGAGELRARALAAADRCGLGVVSSHNPQMPYEDEVREVAAFSTHEFLAKWRRDSDTDTDEEELAHALTEEALCSVGGRRAAWALLLPRADTSRRRRALADALLCWPTVADAENGHERSMHCEYLGALLSLPNTEQQEARQLIRLLLRTHLLKEQEVEWLTGELKADGACVVNAIWIVLLNRGQRYTERVLALVRRHEGHLQTQDIENDLVKELLDNGMLLELVCTPLYRHMVLYLLGSDGGTGYTAQWAASQLRDAGHCAEAGHLLLSAVGVPASLRSYSDAVMYCERIPNN